MKIKGSVAIVTEASSGIGKELIKEWSGDGGEPPHAPDSTDYITKKLISGIENNEAEIYVH